MKVIRYLQELYTIDNDFGMLPAIVIVREKYIISLKIMPANNRLFLYNLTYFYISQKEFL